MSVLSWVIFGLIAGVLTNIFDPSPASGVVGTILLGVLGALLGGFLADLVFGVQLTGFSVQSFIVAVMSSLMLLFASRTFQQG